MDIVINMSDVMGITRLVESSIHRVWLIVVTGTTVQSVGGSACQRRTLYERAELLSVPSAGS